MSDQPQPDPTYVAVVRLEGKVDAALQQQATLQRDMDRHDRTLADQASAIAVLQAQAQASATHATAIVALQTHFGRLPSKFVSPAVLYAILTLAVAALGALVTVLALLR